jgi:hypothetical protein
MYKLFFTTLLIGFFTISINAENNTSAKNKEDIESNSSIKVEPKNESNKTMSKSKIMEKEVKEQMEREKKYAEEQSFAQGDDYDLKAVEVNQDSLDSVPLMEPDYDFDITDVYRDDL